MLDKNSYTPLYEQLRKLIQDQITNGEYENGDKLPSENNLMKTYNITRTTIRKAIDSLVQEGLVEQIHGLGTFVSIREIKKSVWNFQGFSEMAKARNEQPVSKVMHHTVYKTDSGAYLNLVRLRGVIKDGATSWMTMDRSDLPLAIFPGLDQYNFENNSLYEILKRDYRVIPHHVNLEIEPILCDEDTKKMFELHECSSLLKVKGSVFDEGNREIERIEVTYSPRFTFKLTQRI